MNATQVIRLLNVLKWNSEKNAESSVWARFLSTNKMVTSKYGAKLFLNKVKLPADCAITVADLHIEDDKIAFISLTFNYKDNGSLDYISATAYHHIKGSVSGYTHLGSITKGKFQVEAALRERINKEAIKCQKRTSAKKISQNKLNKDISKHIESILK